MRTTAIIFPAPDVHPGDRFAFTGGETPTGADFGNKCCCAVGNPHARSTWRHLVQALPPATSWASRPKGDPRGSRTPNSISTLVAERPIAKDGSLRE